MLFSVNVAVGQAAAQDEILAELTNTTYFRLFQVDLNRPCKFWNKPDAEAGAEEDADAEGGDTDIDDGADVEEDPIQVELTPLELQIEEEGVNMVTHE